MPTAKDAKVALYLPGLLAGMARRHIDTPLRQAHFLAQLGHESGAFTYAEELASGAAYEGRANLGNTHAGDGTLFKGRGLIQLTGRANYTSYGKAVGRDLTSDIDKAQTVATDPALAVDVACWFWETHSLNALADADDVTAITKKINGGINGLDDRKSYLARARFFLKSGRLPDGDRPGGRPSRRSALSRHSIGLPGFARAGLVFAALAGLAMPALAETGVTPIRFAPGTSSAEVSGGVERGGRAIYALGARAGQRMRLRVTAVEHNAAVQVWLPGATLPAEDPMGEITGETLPGAGEGQDSTAWSGRLPRSGTYLVVVGPTRGGATYRLHVSIN